jgi:hypothetical protein
MEEKIYNSTVKGKIKFYSLIIILLSLSLLIESNWFVQLVSTDTSGYTIEQSKSYIIKMENNLNIFSSVILIFSFGLALLLYRFGRRIHKAQQYPPPGANMPFCMKIKRGKIALREAYGLYTASVFIIALGILQLFWQVHLASTMKSFLDVI